ncbi:MAG: isoprenylcysteine carboxylmethyltransferase family protein [Acidobacteria bacterium]|nr:isoprenylcysteine carboxylmethyltransferase family protein [Acidobacteriota bacterium]
MMFLRFTTLAVALLTILFLAAGRLDVWPFWAYVAVIYGIGATTYTLLARWSPGLVAERLKPPSDRDRATRRLVALPLLAHLVLAGIDARYGWSAVPDGLTTAGLALVAAGFLLVGWTLLTNPFASSAVRVQDEREHRVISTGPYALVRHPMYLAVLLVCLGAGPALASWYAGLALVPVIPVFVRRTLVEDAMLQHELPGYQQYASRVRWRVVPGVF